MLAYDRESTLWDAARLLSVGEEGYSYRSAVGARVRTLPEFREISEFFTAELTAQLADARSSTTAKLDAPVNKLARLLNSPSIKRVLLNDSLRLDFDRVIAGAEVLVVKGALGAMGAGNTSVLMQLLVGMLDASLARQQDLLSAERRVAVALKIDEAPLVLNRGFAETLALKRSAGLETVACWQTDAQWVDREVREQLDALFAHRVYFATASARDARAAVALTMAEFSDTIRPGIEHLSALGHPDVRLHLVSTCLSCARRAILPAQPLGQAGLCGGIGPSVADSDPYDGVRRAVGLGRTRDGAGMRPRDLGIAGRHRTYGSLPDTPAESYRELLALDGAASVRWAGGSRWRGRSIPTLWTSRSCPSTMPSRAGPPRRGGSLRSSHRRFHCAWIVSGWRCKPRSSTDFLRTDAAGGRAEVEGFETVRPDAIIEVRGRTPSATDLIVELDDRLPRGRAAAKLERYDHFLTGWSAHTTRYGRRVEASPMVVFVCRDRKRARECARGADAVLTACRAYAGEYPYDWEYSGRGQILFVAERDIHEGHLCAYGVSRLPPEIRVATAGGDPRAGVATAEPRELLAPVDCPG